jgi:hypothetical protein
MTHCIVSYNFVPFAFSWQEGALDSIDKLVGTNVMDSPMFEPLNETLENTNLPEANK